MRTKLLFLALSALILAPATSVQAQTPAARANIELKNVAEVEVPITGADGKPGQKRVPVQKAIPGTVVFYTSTFKNVSAKPAGNISVKNPIPANTTLVAASAYGEGMDIAFSADSGKTWAAADKVKVKAADGKERAAAVSEFTDIRWTLLGELAAGKQGEAGFRVLVK